MRTTAVIETVTDDIIEEPFGDDIEGNFLIAQDTESYEILANHFDVSVELVRAIADAFQFISESIKENVSADLSDIWKRLDNIELKSE